MKTLNEAEKELVQEAIETFKGQTNWKVAAAVALGVSTKTMYNLIRKHGLNDGSLIKAGVGRKPKAQSVGGLE